MTNGTLTTKDGSNTLKVKDVETYNARWSYWSARILGGGGDAMLFIKDHWDFTPDVPSLHEQVQALPVGTRYKIGNHGAYTWTKISARLVAYYLTENPMVNGVEVIDKGLHAGIHRSLNVEVLS